MANANEIEGPMNGVEPAFFAKVSKKVLYYVYEFFFFIEERGGGILVGYGTYILGKARERYRGQWFIMTLVPPDIQITQF